MCGIFGYIHRQPTEMCLDSFSRKLDTLFVLSQTRGKEAAGLSLSTDEAVSTYKDSTAAEIMIRTRGYNEFLKRAWRSRIDPASPIACIGHTRLVTNGSQVVDENNQPVRRGRVVLVHNGIIVNEDEVWKAAGLGRLGQVDTQAAAAFIESRLQKDMDLVSTAHDLSSAIYGESTFAGLFSDRNVMLLTTNTGSMFVVKSDSGDELFFVSERVIAKRVIEKSKFMSGFSVASIRQLKPGEVACVDTVSLKMSVDSSDAAEPSSPAYAKSLGFMRRMEEKSERNSLLRKQMRRCTCCLLPETMPYIRFDERGVCNYCHSYQPIKLKGHEALNVELEAIKSLDRQPNCILSFSGGRDSSYGMHLMVKELGLKPVAFSYDWGMVTDLGRRNQARMCAALGVEHIWISADIKAKRANIRRNVSAWMKRPKLGTIPLFMAGDKHFFYHANETMKHTGLAHLFMCVNHMERTDFKVGFTGTIPKSLRQGVDVEHIHSLPGAAIATMAAFYAKETALNPNYINRSLPDTLSGFCSYYLMKQPHIDLFEYLPWREDLIETVLRGDYDWELAKDAATSWRIGDGTAPFYNYIYYEAAGFTEFDTLRSNQIREGHLSREDGEKLVERDNQPRWESIREYCQLINVDFEDCIRAVNTMPKLYDRDESAAAA